MLKKISICFEGELKDSNLAKVFVENIKCECDTQTEIELYDLSGSEKELSIDELTSVGEKLRLEKTPCFGSECLIVTDSTEIFEKAKTEKTACLPVVVSGHALAIGQSDDDREKYQALLSDHIKMDMFWGADYLITDLDGIDLEYLVRIYQRHHNIPWRILETERTLVREMCVDDLDGLYEIYAKESITRYMEGLYENKEAEKAYIEDYVRHVYKLYEFGMWIVEDKLNLGTIIGRAGLSMREDFEEPELGYVIREEYQGRGYAKEVCKAILEYGYDRFDFQNVRVLMEPENQPSVKLCESLGGKFDREVLLEGKKMLQYIIEQ